MSKDDRLDEKVSQSLSDWGQGLSRRGLLARVGKLMMWVGGISVALPLLPVDRVSAQASCGDWRLCGIYGRLCKECCNGGASLFTCPSCTTIGSFWQRCCTDNLSCPPMSRMIKYYDCCSNSSESLDCRGTTCLNNTTQPAWCTSGLAYRCTIITIGMAC